ncbi:MAG: HAD domain-containing protein [Lachnospiraceae bacterium]
MKIIFLDVDGVLNYIDCENSTEDLYFVEDRCMQLLKQLIERTGAKIVLSSTWRLGWFDIEKGIKSYEADDFSMLCQEFDKYGLTFMSKTPIITRSYGFRGNEIKEWLVNWRGEVIESFVILDDGSDMNPFAHKLVQTSMIKGLEQKHIDQAVQILGENK